MLIHDSVDFSHCHVCRVHLYSHVTVQQIISFLLLLLLLLSSVVGSPGSLHWPALFFTLSSWHFWRRPDDCFLSSSSDRCPWCPSASSPSLTATTCLWRSPRCRRPARWCGCSARCTCTPSSPSSYTWCCLCSLPSSLEPTRPSRYEFVLALSSAVVSCFHVCLSESKHGCKWCH